MVMLSEVTVLPAASWIVAVRTRVVPEIRLAVEPVRAIGGGAVDDGEGEREVPVVEASAVLPS